MKTTHTTGWRMTAGFCKGLHVAALVVMLMAFFPCGEALSIEFITRDEFNARKGAYTDYPVNILFKKLPESNAQETREIRNLIILHQVFDPKMQELEKAGLIEYQKFYGIIKGISGDSLEFWDSESDTVSEFHVGIDLIPTENKKGYKVTKTGISKYAAIVHVLDNRLYKVEISFRPVEPSSLRVERGEQTTNIISWIKPPTDEIPEGYTLYVNGKPTQTVKSTSARVQREKGKVDSYYVRAVYKHGKKTIMSIPSREVADEISAEEIKKSEYANREYESVVVGLTPSKWEDSRDVLYDNESIFMEHLDEDRKTNAMNLIAFFRDIDAGDQLIGKTDVTKQEIDAAETFYRKAEERAKKMPPSLAVGFLVSIKTNDVIAKRAAVGRSRQIKLANERFDQVLAGLTPSDWENARDQLYDSETLFNEYLDEERKTDAFILIQFFRDIGEGDRILGQKRITRQNVDIATEMFTRAGEVAKLLQPDIQVQFIVASRFEAVDKRRNQMLERRALAEKRGGTETQRKIQLANEQYDMALANLTPSNWEQSRDLLYANEKLFSEHLDSIKQRDARTLISFFRDIDNGDKMLATEPPSLTDMEGALRFYRRAEGKAELMQHSVDALFVPKSKIDDISMRLAQLRAEERNRIAAERVAEAQAAAQASLRAPGEATMTAAKKAKPQKIYPPKTELKMAMVSFNKKSYDSSLNHFTHVYKDQIEKIKGDGKKRLSGVMALPSGHRAEVLFLIYYDRLKQTYNDTEKVKNGLARLNVKVENGSGLWAIVSNRKRDKITRHINAFVSE